VASPDTLARLGGWDGGADVVGEVVLDPSSGRVLASVVGGGLVVHRPGEPPARLGEWEGLPDVRVLAVDGAPDGAVVVGTAQGAAVLDPGLQVERLWTAADGLPSDWVQSVRFEERAGRLWLGTYEGLAGVEAGQLTVHLAPWSVFSLAVAHDGGVWAGYEGLRRVHPGNPVETWLEDVHVYGVVERGGTVELATRERGALGMARPHTPVGLPGLRDHAAYGLAVVDGRRWVAAGSRGLRSDEGLAVGRRQGLPADGVRAVAAAPDGSLWVGTDGGLAEVRIGGRTGTRARSLASGFSAVSKVRGLAGTERGLWLATDRGLWSLGEPAGGEGDDLIVAVGQDEVSSVIGTPVGTVAIGRRVVRLGRDGRLRAWTPPAGVVAGAWSQDRLWVGGPEGLWTLQDDQLQRTSGLRDVRALSADERGVWAISGVNLFRVVGAAAVPYLRTHPPLAVATAPGGAWVGTTDGLERLHLGGDDPGAAEDVLGEADAGVAVGALAADGQGGCWFAAADGTVGHVTEDGQARTTRLPGPDAPTPTAVWPDGAHHAWVGTEAGLWRVSLRSAQ
jgi:ligand-binding sensor domain-containing protein